MPAFVEKTLIMDFKAIKIGIIFGLALFLGLFFFIGDIKAVGFFTDDFEVYDSGDLGGQGDWELQGACYNWQVSTTTSESGTKSVTNGNVYGYGVCNTKYNEGVDVTTSGIFSFSFKCSEGDRHPKGCILAVSLGQYDEPQSLDFPRIYINTLLSESYPEIARRIWLQGFGTSTYSGVLVAESFAWDDWHRIKVEYDYTLKRARARLDDGIWSDYEVLDETLDYANQVRIVGQGFGGVEVMWLDHIYTTAEYIPLCGYGSDCAYCNTSTTCAFHNCIWSENFCWSTIPPILPELEDCSELGITDRLICEIKNFGYRIFVPTPEKITELRATLDLIKDRFPYNYIMEFKDFFVYLRDNINDEQGINFSIMGQSASLNFAFWNTTTTIAGSEQTIKDIVQKVFGFIIILVFGFWCFGFIKRVFK